MNPLRFLFLANPRTLLAFVVAALAVQATVPAGLMIVPATEHGAQFILCPQSHPLARALSAQSDDQADTEMAAFHAVMGHGDMGHAVMDHAAMGHSGAPDDPDPAPSAAPVSQSCAFAGGGALAALLADRTEALSARLVAPDLPPAVVVNLRLAHPPHLRPPLRGPPVLI